MLGEILSVQWVRYWYGVFSEHGYPGDPLYPGEGTSCGQRDWWRLCPQHKQYDREMKTKQNTLCHVHSAREIIDQHPRHRLYHYNGTSDVKFSYLRTTASSYKLLLDTSSYMGEQQRWENVRRALHRFIHLLPLGTTIRSVIPPRLQVRCQNILRFLDYFYLQARASFQAGSNVTLLQN